jgi:hypothetical protein
VVAAQEKLRHGKISNHRAYGIEDYDLLLHLQGKE